MRTFAAGETTRCRPGRERRGGASPALHAGWLVVLLLAVIVAISVVNVGIIEPRLHATARAGDAAQRLHEAMLDGETALRAALTAGAREGTFLDTYTTGTRAYTQARTQLSEPGGPQLTPQVIDTLTAADTWSAAWATPLLRSLGRDTAGRLDPHGADPAAPGAAPAGGRALTFVLQDGKSLFDRYRHAHAALRTGLAEREASLRRWSTAITAAGLVVAAAAAVTHAAQTRRTRRRLTRLSRQANEDALTGAGNRRAFDAALTRLLTGGGQARPVALILFDIDHFKGFNDRFGHPAGDAALRAVAHVAAGGCRAVDRLYRVGGEEFALVLPATDLPAAAAAAGRLMDGLARMQVPVAVTVTVAVSAGIAVAHHAVHGQALIAAADEALYRAKAAGRNRVEPSQAAL